MLGYVRKFLRILPLLPVVGSASCTCMPGAAPVPQDPVPHDAGKDATDLGPCGVDCSGFETPPCTMAVCYTGQVLGPLNTCVVVPAQGTACDDGKFCTINDV